MIRTLFAIITLFISTAHAYPTKGYWIPRAGTLAQGEIKFDMQVQQGAEKGKPNQNATVIGLENGILDWNNLHAEFGVDWVEPTTDDINHGIVGNFKASYQNLFTEGLTLAVGASDFAVRSGQNDNNIVYSVLEANIGETWIVAMGGFAGNEQLIRSSSGAVVGVWKRIQQGTGDMGVEWMSGQGKLGYIVPGLRVEVRDGFEAIISYAIAGNRETFRNLFLARMTVYF